MPFRYIGARGSRIQWSTGWAGKQKNVDESALGGMTSSTAPDGASLKFSLRSADVPYVTSFSSTIEVVACASSNGAPTITVDSQPFPVASPTSSTRPCQSRLTFASTELQQHTPTQEAMQVDANRLLSSDDVAVAVQASGRAILQALSPRQIQIDPNVTPNFGPFVDGVTTILPNPTIPGVTDAFPTLTTNSASSGPTLSSSTTSGQSHHGVSKIGLSAAGIGLAAIIMCICSYVILKRSRSKPNSIPKAMAASTEFIAESEDSESGLSLLNVTGGRGHGFIFPYTARHSHIPRARKHEPPEEPASLDDDHRPDPGPSSLPASLLPTAQRSLMPEQEKRPIQSSVVAQRGVDEYRLRSDLGLHQVVENDEGISIVPSDWTAPPAYSR
ncbi:hypothetical protein EIP91_010800 [Steccherinum ochraceum]|uniref:Uncharacterized protein n=1 Tax=Steccherinum ochraceum TaxID=92696 RepID=A0A4R0R2Q6_9APHY|nr:hypothetical protein EIP91_010800 [Steccherinum ochraceum]